MIEILEKLLKENLEERLNSNDLVYVGYLCDKLKDKNCELYIENELDDYNDESDRMFLAEEYQDLVNNEHINDCNFLF